MSAILPSNLAGTKDGDRGDEKRREVDLLDMQFEHHDVVNAQRAEPGSKFRWTPSSAQKEL